MRCDRCGGNNRWDAVFCSGCGFRLERRCKSCDAPLAPDDRFCSSCGTRAATSDGQAPAPGAGGERKHVTVLFADLAGSTELVDRADPEEAAGLLRAAVSAMIEAAHRYGGTVNEVRGDGIMALFGAPLAVEDHAVRACYAALDMPSLVAESTGGAGEVRVGLHAGEVLVRTVTNDIADGYVAVGSTVHLAARMEQMAEPGRPLATVSTARLAEGFARFATGRLVRVRGFDEPVEVCELLGRTENTGTWANRVRRRLTTFVGREREVEALVAAAERARIGEGAVYLVEGNPGVGKSRLVYEFTRRLADDTALLHAQATPYDVGTPYFVVRQLVERWLESEPAGGALEDVVAALDPSLVEVVPLVAFVLGEAAGEVAAMDSVHRRRAVADGLRAVFEAMARRRSIVFVVEDLHWIDETSMSVLSDMLSIAETAPVMAVATHRPEFQSKWHRPWLHRIKLDTLDRGRGALFLDTLLGHHPSLNELKGVLLEEGSGTPLFYEELVRSLLEVGVLVGEPGERRLVTPIDEVEIPEGVVGVIAERIDRLDPDAKQALQVASVIGEDVSLELMSSVAGAEGSSLEEALEALRVAEFLFERGSSSSPGELTFKHNLIREVAYSGIPIGTRKLIHGSVLDVMTGLGVVGDQVERAARHARFAERWDRAADLALEAARRSEDRSSYRDAVRYLQWAREALPWVESTGDRVRQRIDAAIALRTSHTGAGLRMDDVLPALDEAERLAEEIGDRRRTALVNLHRSYLCSTIGRYGQGLPSARRAAEIGEELGSRVIAADARIAEAQCLTQAGYAIGIEEVLRPHLDFILTEMRTERLGMVGNRGVWALMHLGMSKGLQGRFVDAETHLCEAEGIIGETDRPFDRGYLGWVRGVLAFTAERVEDGMRQLTEAVEVASRYEMRWQESWLEVFLAFGLIASRRFGEAEELLEKTTSEVERLGAPAVEAWTRFHVGLLALRRRSAEEALPHLEAALEWGIAAESPTLIVDAHRFLARVRPDDVEWAEGHLVSAAEEAQRAGLRPFFARARYEWAYVLASHGFVDEASAIVDEVNAHRSDMGLPSVGVSG